MMPWGWWSLAGAVVAWVVSLAFPDPWERGLILLAILAGGTILILCYELDRIETQLYAREDRLRKLEDRADPSVEVA